MHTCEDPSFSQPGVPKRLVVTGLINAGRLLAAARAAVLGGGWLRALQQWLCPPLMLAARAPDSCSPCRRAQATGEVCSSVSAGPGHT